MADGQWIGRPNGVEESLKERATKVGGSDQS